MIGSEETADPSVPGCDHCHLLQTELNLVNKLLFFEQKYSDHLKSDLIATYDQLLGKTSDRPNRLATQEAIADENETQLKKLRNELNDWRRLHSRLDTSDHKSVPSTDSKECITRVSVSCDTQTRVRIASTDRHISQEVVEPQITPPDAETTAKPNHSANQVPVKLEMIPKPEPLSSDEDDCVIEGVSPIAVNTPAVPTSEFQFLSQYLYRKAREESSANGRELNIDLTTDSDNDTRKSVPFVFGSDPAPSTIFTDDIVDLTPKTKKTTIRTALKRKSRLTKKNGTVNNKAITKRTANNRKPESVSKQNQKPSPSLQITKQGAHLRVIESNRKQIRINNDNTITIIDVTHKPGAEVTPKQRTDSSKKTGIKEVKKTDVKEDVGLNIISKEGKRKFNEEYVKKNKKIVKRGNLYFCKWAKCTYTSSMRANAIRHMWTHTGEKPFSCRVCGQGFTETTKLYSHVMAHNATEPNARHCPACDKSYGNVEFNTLMRHMKTHGLEKAEKWKNEYSRQRKLLKDKQKHDISSEPTKVIKKKILPKDKQKVNITPKTRTESSKKTKSGVKDMSSEPEPESDPELNQEWKCDFPNCSRTYGEKHNLKRHQMNVHKKISRPLFKGTLPKNDKTIKFFIPKAFEVKSIKPRNYTPDMKFFCNDKKCLKGFLSMSGLYRHKRKCHQKAQIKNQKTAEQKKAWICTECPASYDWKGSLTKHMANEHKTEEEEDYPCPYDDCQFRANTQKSQLIHWKKHFSDEDKPFKCLIAGCNYSNKELASLKYHVWNKHSEQQFFRAMEETGIHYPIWY